MKVVKILNFLSCQAKYQFPELHVSRYKSSMISLKMYFYVLVFSIYGRLRNGRLQVDFDIKLTVR